MPNDIPIHIEITVDQMVSNAYYFVPRDIGVFFSDFIRNMICGFSKDLQKSCDSQGKCFIRVKIRSFAVFGKVNRLFGGFQHVQKSYLVVMLRHIGRWPRSSPCFGSEGLRIPEFANPPSAARFERVRVPS